MACLGQQDRSIGNHDAQGRHLASAEKTGTSFDRLRFATKVSTDRVHKSALLSGIRTRASQKDFFVTNPGMNDISIYCSLTKDAWCDRKFAGRQLPDSKMQQGDVVVVPAYADGSFYSAIVGGSGYNFLINPAAFEDVLGEEVTHGREPHVKPSFGEHNSILQTAARAYETEFEKQDPFSAIAFDSIALVVYTELARTYGEFGGANGEGAVQSDDKRVETAIDYIIANLDEPIGLKDIAENIGVSQYHFVRLFRTTMGVTPYQYVREQRIRKSMQLLRESKLPIAEIAYECGFSSQQHFTTAFKGRFNVPPGQWRRLRSELN